MGSWIDRGIGEKQTDFLGACGFKKNALKILLSTPWYREQPTGKPWNGESERLPEGNGGFEMKTGSELALKKKKTCRHGGEGNGKVQPQETLNSADQGGRSERGGIMFGLIGEKIEGQITHSVGKAKAKIEWSKEEVTLAYFGGVLLSGVCYSRSGGGTPNLPSGVERRWERVRVRGENYKGGTTLRVCGGEKETWVGEHHRGK